MRKRNIDLQQLRTSVDLPLAMAPVDAPDQHDPAERGRAAGPALSLRDLSHELNSRLDGAMRSVRLAQQALSEPASDDASRDEILARLHLAQEVMHQMAAMLKGVLSDQAPGPPAPPAPSRLEDEVARTVDSLRPLAEDLRVDLEIGIDVGAAALDAGPLGIVMHNGLRNAIRACAAQSRRLVQVQVTWEAGAGLAISIIDSGPGLEASGRGPKPARDGHGMGLDLSRRIVARLGGRLTLESRAQGGAQFLVQVPADRITRS